VDRSDPSRQALQQAAAWSRHFHARLRLIEVIAPAPAASHEGMVPESPAAEARLDELMRFAKPAHDAGVVVDVRLTRGAVGAQILQQADLMSADLIVMGTRGRTPAEASSLGSVTEHVLRKAACPVLAVPPRTSLVGVPPRTIVCATDFSAAASRAVAYAVGLADHASARLVLVHVIGRAGSLPADNAELEAIARDRLARALPDVARAVHHPLELVASGDPAGEIVRLAAAQQADLIVIGVYGTGAADPSVLGSTAYRVIAAASCPVLTVRFTQ
jgi:nucleotide-binding universal stress UspA family protein